jgi:hypothetical protein
MWPKNSARVCTGLPSALTQKRCWFWRITYPAERGNTLPKEYWADGYFENMLAAGLAD